MPTPAGPPPPPQAVHALGKDPAFRRAQNIWQYSLYYQPSQALARVLGARWVLGGEGAWSCTLSLSLLPLLAFQGATRSPARPARPAPPRPAGWR